MVIVRAGALIQLSTAAVTTDAEARALVNRLASATPEELIGASRSSYVPDPGPPPPAS